MSKLFLLIPLESKIKRTKNIQDPFTPLLVKYLNSDLISISDVEIDSIKGILISLREEKKDETEKEMGIEDKEILIVPKDNIEDFSALRSFESECFEKLEKYKPDSDLEFLVYITDSEEKFYKVTRFPGDPEKGWFLFSKQVMGSKILGGVRRLGAIMQNEPQDQVNELSSLLISVAAVTIVIANRLSSIRKKLDETLERLKGTLSIADYEEFSKDIIALSRICDEYILLGRRSSNGELIPYMRSELCAGLLIKYRRISGIEKFKNEVEARIDTLKDYMGSRISLRAEKSSADMLKEIESIGRLQNIFNDIMNYINIIIAAGIAISFSGSISTLIKLLPPGINEFVWGLILFLLAFLILLASRSLQERKYFPLFKMDLSEEDIRSILNREVPSGRKMKFDQVLVDLSGGSKKAIWRIKRIRGNPVITFHVEAHSNKAYRIQGISFETTGLKPEEAKELSKRCISSLLMELRSNGVLKESSDGLFLYIFSVQSKEP
jgi:hypothetical protein